MVYVIEDVNGRLVRLYFKNGLEKHVDSENVVQFSGFMIGKIIVIDNTEFLYPSTTEETSEESQEGEGEDKMGGGEGGGGGVEVEEAVRSCDSPFSYGIQKVAYILFNYRDEVIAS